METKMGGKHMIVSVANNIISPLGMSTAENYAAVKAGQSALRCYEGKWDLPEPFVASLVDRDKVEQAFATLADNAKYTFFEKMIILSASRAIQEAGVNTESERVLFILSTTKGNVFLLDKRETGFPEERVLLGSAARQMTEFFHNPNLPIVVSNACISGVCAQIEAMRNLESGYFDYVVTIGCDVQSAFIVSGFQSFKALSPEPCKPFDANRCGLNLGDAAATIIYTRKDTVNPDEWVACRGAIRNDANHISGPSRTGEGSYRALKVALGDAAPDQIAFINAHGTPWVQLVFLRLSFRCTPSMSTTYWLLEVTRPWVSPILWCFPTKTKRPTSGCSSSSCRASVAVMRLCFLRKEVCHAETLCHHHS